MPDRKDIKAPGNALTPRQKEILLDAGFLPKEIKALNKAKTPGGRLQDFDFNAPVFQRAINARRQHVYNIMRARTVIGIPPNKIAAEIQSRILRFYRRNQDMTVFDFIKDEYKVEERQKGEISPSAMKENRRRRAAISRTFGKGYGTFTPKATT